MSITRNNDNGVNTQEKVCATVSPEDVCKTEFGGVPILVADGNNKTTWQCDCQWPNWTAEPSCTLNPMVCSSDIGSPKGVFDWDISKGPPDSKFCKCPDGLTKIVLPSQIPICVKNPGLFYNK
jgi:hypothetical protein